MNIIEEHMIYRFRASGVGTGELVRALAHRSGIWTVVASDGEMFRARAGELSAWRSSG